MKKHLTAAADGRVWIVTAALIGVAILLLALASAITTLPPTVFIVMYSVAGVIGLVLFIGWLAKPSHYEIRDDSVSIIRNWPFPKIVIEKSDIKDVRHARLKSVVPTSIAVMAVFGYAGRFRSEGMGEFTLLATNPNEIVLIEAKRRYAVSPSNPKRFMHDIKGKR